MTTASLAADNQVAPGATSASWRTWLMTGRRQTPIARRRLRGAHQGLKRLLVEGVSAGREDRRSWTSFSDAMVRHAVAEAVSALPPPQKQLVKLAYFSDLSNREIAQGLGMTVSSVERGLREAIARVSEHVERGRAAGRRAIYGLAMFLGGRWLIHAHQALSPSAEQWIRAGALVVAAATAGAVLASHPASPAPLPHVEKQTAPAIEVSQTYPTLQQRTMDIRNASKDTVNVIPNAPPASTVTDISNATAVVPPAVRLPVSVKLPPLPPPPVIHRVLGA